MRKTLHVDIASDNMDEFNDTIYLIDSCSPVDLSTAEGQEKALKFKLKENSCSVVYTDKEDIELRISPFAFRISIDYKTVPSEIILELENGTILTLWEKGKIGESCSNHYSETYKDNNRIITGQFRFSI